jgi:hypothetical protein
MHCSLCQSSNQAEFTAEMMIHFDGRRCLDNPGVLVFPKVLICLNCGFSRFTTQKTDLGRLAGDNIRTEASTQRLSVAAA